MPASSDDPVTVWMTNLAQGDDTAAREIWGKYFDKLVRLASRKLNASNRRMADEEDVALSAMHSFCKGLSAGRYEWLADRDDMWKLLVTITARKAYAQIRGERAQKRGGGKVRGESVFMGKKGDEDFAGIGEVLGEAPTPEFASMVAEECRQRLEELGDDSLRQIAVLKMEGYTNEEIAERMDCALRTVERKLDRIRTKWFHGKQA